MGRELEEIKNKVESLLNDDSLGAVGKKYPSDYHVELGMKRMGLLEEDIPNLISTIEGLKGEVERLKLDNEVKTHALGIANDGFIKATEQVETYRKALEEIVPCIQTMQCTSESESLRYNTGNLVIHKIRKALGDLS